MKSIEGLNQRHDRLINNQAELHRMMLTLAANQERIMGKISLNSYPPIKSTLESSLLLPSSVNNTLVANTTSITSPTAIDSTETEASDTVSNDNTIDLAISSATTACHTDNNSFVNHDDDMSAVFDQVSEQLARYLTNKKEMDRFETILTLLFQKHNRPSCMVALLYHFFSKEELAETWYGKTSVRPKKVLDPKRVAIVKDLTLIRFPPKYADGESRKKILYNLNARIRNKCLFSNKTIKTEKPS